MRKYINNWSKLKHLLLLCSLLGIGITACEEEEWSKDYDIDWPLPVIQDISPGKAMVGSTVTITGTNFEKTTHVYIGDVRVKDDAFELVDGNSITFTVPRVVDAGKVRIRTAYARETESEENFIPQYPVTNVAQLPTQINRGSSFTITGENVDLITHIQLGDTTLIVNGADAKQEEFNIPTSELNLPLGTLTLKILAAKGKLEGSLSSELEIVRPPDYPLAMAPTVLFDFEDGVNPFQPQADGLSPEASIDGGTGVKSARGDHYLSVIAQDVSSGWKDVGYIEIAEAVDITGFSHPHISFLVNTNGNAGYFELLDNQGNWYHFKQSPDDYKFATDGWEWRSYNLDQVDDGQALDYSNFHAKLMFKTGNVSSGTFEIHVDQIMITNGKVNQALKLTDFEDASAQPFENSSGATAGFNQGDISAHVGDGYFTIQKSGVDSWSDLGRISFGKVDLSEMTDPHLSFWINTSGDGGYIELLDGQGSWAHFTNSDYGDDYKFTTNGEWELRSVRLAEMPWEGTGYDPNNYEAILNIKTGNVAGDFVLNVDDVFITDGPMY